MTVYFARLGCSGALQTGLDADKRPNFTGHPHQGEVVKEMKQDQLKAVATKGHVTMPVDPFEIGHAAAYFDEHIAGEVNVDPQRLADLCLADTSMGLMLGFDEATKIKYVTAEGTRSGIFFHVFLSGFFSARVCARCGEAAPDDHLCSLPIDIFRLGPLLFFCAPSTGVSMCALAVTRSATSRFWSTSGRRPKTG